MNLKTYVKEKFQEVFELLEEIQELIEDLNEQEDE